jgi:hypothetical protein
MRMEYDEALQACIETARHVTLEQFVRRWRGHYFLVKIPGGDSDDWDMDFHTGILSVDDLKQGLRDTTPPADAADAEAPPGQYLFEIKKTAKNSSLEWIAIGRAKNNDVILRHQSVSKLHARFHTNQEAFATEGESDGFWLTDMKSTTGTWINDVPLAPSQPHPLSPGDQLRFGQVICHFLDSGALYNRLSRM